MTIKLIADILETIMLICFGCSWPINAYKAYKAGTAKATSVPFILLIITGYIAGLISKYLNGNVVFGETFNFAMAMYYVNLITVSLNLCVYFRNRALDKKAGK